MSPKRAKRANELPFIPLGPFQWRIPGIHYRIEYVEFFQGLILGATALSSIPYLTDNLGLPYELAWSCVIIEVFMYMLHGWLGDPVVPGWITPTLPFTLAYLNGFEKGPDRIQAMIALQLLVAFVFIFMGITKLADKFVNGVPNSIKGGILIAAPITVLQGQLSDGSQLMTAPVATLAGTLLLAFLSFSPFCEKNRSKYKILDNKIPRLCTDRLDGVLHSCYIWLKTNTIEDIKEVYNNLILLTNENNNLEIGFKDIEVANKFSKMVYKYATEFQSNNDKYVMKYISELIKLAIDRKLISLEDLYTMKESKICNIFDNNFNTWKYFKNIKYLINSNNIPNNTFYISFDTKRRYVIPLVRINNKNISLDIIYKDIYDKLYNYSSYKYCYAPWINKLD